MALIRMIPARSWRTLLLSGVSATVGVRVMAFVNERMIQGPDIDRASLMEFAVLLVAMFAVASAAQMMMTRLGHRLVYELRRSLVKRILDTDCERLEHVGPARILASLSSDTGHITSAFISLPNAVYGTVLTSGALGYLAWLSLPLFWAIAGWLSLAVLIGWLLLVRKAKMEQGKLLDLKLSQGQRKRLALLLAALEERPILILDEWAADQDPSFRETFYFELLPKLKATGTTIFAITHDDRYFHLADRQLKMDGGHLTEMAIPQAMTAAGVRSGAASVASR
ncbi:MAG: hypothetical protein AB1648_05035 [Pseudomonadota bacterium]|jgi:ABC-type siderophore export system fused ATPase/permease subunit